MNSKYLRTVVILAPMVLAGVLAALGVDIDKIMVIVASVTAPVGTYVGIKGRGNTDY